MNLSAYLERIGFSQPVAPTLDVLRQITYKHPTSIPFENLNPFLGLPVEITQEALEQKLIRGGRGGYCYEQNALLRDALETIGFNVSGLAARVLFMRTDDTLPARSHMLLLVEVDGRVYMVDSGFGGATPTAPLELLADVEQDTPHETYRLRLEDGEWLTEVRKNGVWEKMYRFDLQRQIPQDYMFPNYFVSTHPTSIFVNNLMLARPVDGGRYTINNTQLSFHPVNAEPERQLLDSPAELIQALVQHFEINISELPQLESRLASLFEKTPV